MNKKPCILITVSLCLSGFSQEKISYFNKEINKEITLTVSENMIHFKGENAKKMRSIFKDSKIFKVFGDNFIMEVSSKDKIRGMLKEKERLQIEPVLVAEDKTLQLTDNEIIVRASSIEEIARRLKFGKEEVEIIPDHMAKDIYTLRFPSISTKELFNWVTNLQKDRNVAWAEPNFILLMQTDSKSIEADTPPESIPFATSPSSFNDPYLNSQWSIQNNGYLGGTPGIDMNVFPAWNLSKGQGVVVAVLDDGVDLSHPDLVDNLLPGYDALGISGGNPEYGNSHGTSCAGIIGAVANNGIGIVGVAHEAKILPVRLGYTQNGYYQTTALKMANGIYWAANNGADILSNSWSGGSYSSVKEQAIDYAVASGRNGKGSVVLFSPGNGNSTSIAFPSYKTNVITVAALSMCDERKKTSSCDGETWWGSDYGNALDISAPGVKVYTTTTGGGYTSSFNGTSAACPNAAGVAALNTRSESRPHWFRC